MGKLFMFAGTGGAMAYSVEETGANLPVEYRPWHFCRQVSTDGPTFRTGSDKRALEEVEAEGFSVVVFAVSLEKRSERMRSRAPMTRGSTGRA